MQKSEVSFLSLDLGSAKPTSVPMETIEVQLNPNDLMMDYAKAFVHEGYRVHPLRMEQIALTKEEVYDYCVYLLDRRIASVNGDCPEYRKLKAFYIPVWIQHNLSMIGRVILRDEGLTLNPTLNEKPKITFEEALVISEKIGMLIDDLQIVQDAMPRSSEGDKDVMSTALIAGYVRSIHQVTHISSTYITAFLGMKLREELAFKTIYRIQYDDLAFIASALTSQRSLF